MSVTYYHTEKGSFKVYPTGIEKFNEKSAKWEKFHGNHFDILDHRPFGSSLLGSEKTSAFLERLPVSSLAIQVPPVKALAPFKAALPPMVIKPIANPATSILIRMISLARRIR